MNPVIPIVFGGLILAWFIQSFFAFKQAKHIQKVYKELTNRYKGKYCIGFGQARARFIGRGCMVMIVADYNMQVKDSMILKGVSVFGRMKSYKQLIGKNLEESKIMTTKRGTCEQRAVNNAADHINEYMKENVMI